MSDDLKNRGGQDRTRININEAWERRYWSKTFGCTPWELRAAINVVGTSARNVAAHLGKARASQAAGRASTASTRPR